MIAGVIGGVLCVLALSGIGYTLFAASALRTLAGTVSMAGVAEPVSLLKPLYGAEPRLAQNLATFLDQDWPAPLQMVAGVHHPQDPALGCLAGLPAGPRRTVTPVIDATVHGANGKVGNLVNMLPSARHDLLVISDSDMAVPRDYLAAIAGALAQPGTGAVTCLYRGRGDAGGWSRLAAAGISYQFLPSVMVGLRTGLATPCMGSTIALRRATLERIGGFARFADRLADDYEIGAAIRALDLRVAVPPIVLTHGCAETSLGAVWRQERRWAATLRLLDPWGYLGTVATHPLPLALLGLPFVPRAGAVVLIAALLARLWLKRTVDHAAGAATAPAWLLPLRDCLSFAVFVAAFFTRSVDWRGTRLRMERRGHVVSATESPR